jgi:hypothetical protein
MDHKKDSAPELLEQFDEAAKETTKQTEVSATEAPAVKHLEPAPGTVRHAIFAALRRGEKLTPKDAWLRFGTSRLAAVVFTLQQKYGCQINSEIIPVGTADGRVAYVAQYSMQEAV